MWNPGRTEHLMGDDDFIVCLRRRLLYEDPAAQGQEPCAHRAVSTNRVCGSTARRRYGIHAVCCSCGPGFVRRHNECRDALRAWLGEEKGEANVTTEQHIPGWDRATSQGIEHAVLDVVLVSATGRVAVDVSVAEATSSDDRTSRARARADGAAAREREQEKHRRYPGPGLVAAALETGGRMGKELRGFLRAQAATDERRASSLRDIRQRLTTALQRGVAAMLLGSAGQRPRPWRASCPALAAGAAARCRLA